MRAKKPHNPLYQYVRHLSQTPSCSRRVVVTGMGLVTCLGVGVQHVWHRLVDGHCGLQRLSGSEYEKIPCKVAGTVPRGKSKGELSLDKYIAKSSQREMSLATCYAIVAAEEALTQAGWMPQSETDRINTGVAIGMGMVPLDEIVSTGQALQERGYNRVNPHFIPKILVNMAAGHISLKYGFKGVNHAVSTACTTGAHAVGDAARFIRYGDARVMVCGGTEASVGPLGMAGFSRMRALSTHFNERPLEASRPFDRAREGFVMAEGAGVLVLEDLEHALARGATILGEILGYGLSADANHVTAPSETGDGALRCMKASIGDAGLAPGHVGYVNAHATSTPLGDAAECRAIQTCFGDHYRQVAVSSTKGAVGHLLGAAGSVEAIFTLLACQHGALPPNLNCQDPDPDLGLNIVTQTGQSWGSPGNRRVALSNSFGFGGTNASLCLASYT